MIVLTDFKSPQRAYSGIQDPTSSRITIPFIGNVDIYHYWIGGVKYLADRTFLNQCIDGDRELVGTIPLHEDEVIFCEETEG